MLVVIGLALFGSAVLCSALLCLASRRIARRVGFVDEPGERKIHRSPVALGGGFGFFLTTVGLAAGAVVFALMQPRGGAAWLPNLIREHIPRVLDRAPLLGYVLAGGTVLFVLGLLDDIFGLSAWLRLAVQGVVAALLYFASHELRVTAFVGLPWLSFAYTVLWVVGITNAFNLLDNMDGLSAGVAVTASASFFAVAAMTGQYFLAALLAVFAGSLVGFLIFNFPPASMFMGDAGSNFIGFMLGELTILFTFYMPGQGIEPACSLLTPLVILAVPIYDTLSVVTIRLAARRPIFVGDTNHFSHRLVALGMGNRSAVLTICLLTLGTGLLAPLLMRLDTFGAILVIGNVTVTLVVIWVLEHVGRRTRNGRGEVS